MLPTNPATPVPTPGFYNVGTGVATPYRTIAEMIDKDAIRYVPNPLTSYQYYTRADTTRLKRVLGDCKFVTIEKGMREMKVMKV